MEPADTQQRWRQPGFRYLVLLALVAVNTVASLVAVPTPYETLYSSLRIGGLLAQPLLCALWAAWSPQRFFVRLLSAGALNIALLLVSGTYPQLGNLVLFNGLFLLILLMLISARRYAGWRIVDGSLPLDPQTVQSERQFTLRDLLIGITVFALLLSLTRYTAPFVQSELGPSDFWGIFLGVVAICIMMLPAFGGLVLALSTALGGWRAWLVLPPAVALASCLASLVLWLGQPGGGRGVSEYLMRLFLFSIGSTTWAVGTAFVLRAIGYRVAQVVSPTRVAGEN